MRLKQLRERTYCMENEPCRRSSVYKNYFIGRASSGRDRNLRSKILTPSSRSFSLLEIARFLKLGAAPEELSAFTFWPSLNIEPTRSQISEETLKVWSYREELRASNSTEQTTEGHPQSGRHATTRGIPSSHTGHFKLKSSIKQPLKWLNRVVFYL